MFGEPNTLFEREYNRYYPLAQHVLMGGKILDINIATEEIKKRLELEFDKIKNSWHSKNEFEKKKWFEEKLEYIKKYPNEPYVPIQNKSNDLFIDNINKFSFAGDNNYAGTKNKDDLLNEDTNLSSINYDYNSLDINPYVLDQTKKYAVDGIEDEFVGQYNENLKQYAKDPIIVKEKLRKLKYELDGKNFDERQSTSKLLISSEDGKREFVDNLSLVYHNNNNGIPVEGEDLTLYGNNFNENPNDNDKFDVNETYNKQLNRLKRLNDIEENKNTLNTAHQLNKNTTQNNEQESKIRKEIPSMYEYPDYDYDTSYRNNIKKIIDDYDDLESINIKSNKRLENLPEIERRINGENNNTSNSKLSDKNYQVDEGKNNDDNTFNELITKLKNNNNTKKCSIIDYLNLNFDYDDPDLKQNLWLTQNTKNHFNCRSYDHLKLNDLRPNYNYDRYHYFAPRNNYISSTRNYLEY